MEKIDKFFEEIYSKVVKRAINENYYDIDEYLADDWGVQGDMLDEIDELLKEWWDRKFAE